MSFLKISDPLKRDSIVKEYLELKKNIRDNFLSERIGEQQLQTDLSKFYRPITETQKATAREITEGLKPIREGIEKLPEAMQPIGEATGEATEEEEEEDDEELVGEIAYEFLNKPFSDTTFGIRKEKGHHYIGNKHVIVDDNDIIISENGERFEGTPGLWELIMSKIPKNFTDKDYDNYEDLMIMTITLFIVIMMKTTLIQKEVEVLNGKNYLVPFGIGKKVVYLDFLRKRKGMRERELLLFRVILTRC